MFSDSAWSLTFNLLNKSQTIAVIVAGLVIHGVIGIGEVTTVVAAATLGAGLADFGYSYECGRFVASNPTRPAAQRVIRRLGALIAVGAALSYVSFRFTVGIDHPWSTPWTLAAIAVLGGAFEASVVLLQLLYSLDRFRTGSAILGVFRAASGPLAIAVAAVTTSVAAVAITLAATEIVAASALFIAARRVMAALPDYDPGGRIGLSYLWLGVGSVANMFANRGDVLVVGALADPLALGIYSVASQIENAIESLALVPSSPLLVRASRARAERAPIRPLMRRAHRATLGLSVASTALVLLLYAGYLAVATSDHQLSGRGAVLTITICAAASSLVASAGVNMTALLALQRYRLASVIRLSSGALAIVLFVTLVPHFAAPGAAIAAAGRDASLFVLSQFAARKATDNEPTVASTTGDRLPRRA
jgi:O-antigen/teichoic acid export membrane protein